MKTSLSQARGIYSSKGTIIIPHQIIARYEYSATTYKGPPFGYSEGTIIITRIFEEYIPPCSTKARHIALGRRHSSS